MNMDFVKEKRNIIQKLKNLNERVCWIESEFSIDMSFIKEKINKAIKNIENEVFSIALFGAFSDGKSTILSILIDNFRIPISPEPTTDRVTSYDFENYRIIDTPGLFSENLMHDELTMKYISEANVVIYTVDSVNPLKESHIETVKWILKDLKKFDSTIFVINKMDEVADLEDDEDFKKAAYIKKKVVSEIIQKITGIDSKPKIACIAADPYGQGLEFWKEQEGLYKKLSRVDDLKSMIYEFISAYKEKLILKSGLSVIQDTVNRMTSDLKKIKSFLSFELKLLDNQIKEYSNNIRTLERDIEVSFKNIKEDLISLRNDILIEIDSAKNIEELDGIFQRRIGEDGYILKETVNLIIKKYTLNVLSEEEKTLRQLEESLTYHLETQNKILEHLTSFGKSALKEIAHAPTRDIANYILKIRDILKIPIKFKPWGAVKVAKVLKAAPLVAEVIECASGIAFKVKIENKRKELKDEVENMFKELIQGMTIEDYIRNYFSFKSEIDKAFIHLEKNKKEIEEKIFIVDEINKQLKLENLNNELLSLPSSLKQNL